MIQTVIWYGDSREEKNATLKAKVTDTHHCTDNNNTNNNKSGFKESDTIVIHTHAHAHTHRTLTWTAGSLTCVRAHSYARVYPRGLGTPGDSESAQHFLLWKTQVFLALLTSGRYVTTTPMNTPQLECLLNELTLDLVTYRSPSIATVQVCDVISVTSAIFRLACWRKFVRKLHCVFRIEHACILHGCNPRWIYRFSIHRNKWHRPSPESVHAMVIIDLYITHQAYERVEQKLTPILDMFQS